MRLRLATMAAVLLGIAAAPPATIEEFSGKVVSLSDGDTLTVLKDRKQIKVRVEGIDAPEKSQAFGNKSKNALADLIGRKEVAIHATGTDKYGRTLARVIFDGRDISELMVARGMAWHYKEYSDDETLAELEDKARASKLGLWAEPDALPPWEFRKNRSKPIDEIELETLIVVIDGLDYLIRSPGGKRDELRKAELKQIIESAKMTTGNSDGIRVKILRTENARASAELILVAELNSAGILTGIVMPDEFLPSSAAEP